ncbi:MAG: DUF6314 family protein [Chlamydiae bacterium]|nr:DUF6314 family protein [Chlamydiota bacterium]
MLELLVGNKSVQKILLFLFVNRKCYGTQVQKLLTCPLTPIQKALQRLEKGGIILSFFEGKTRFYQFNPTYPLIEELEELLKKAYTLLPPEKKRQFSYVQQDRTMREVSLRDSQETLSTIWERLSKIRYLNFYAKTKSKQESGWNGKGKGEVIVTKEGDRILLFHERGNWQNEQGSEFDFSNIFRWTLDSKAKMISLEHLRRGLNQPVFLFHLSPSGNGCLSSIDSHLCEGDAYFGQIFCDRHYLRLNWRVIGPKKNEEIDYYYA